MSKLVYKHNPEVSKKSKEVYDFKFTPQQEKLLRVRLYGLRAYSAKQQQSLSIAQKLEIEIKHELTRKKLSEWRLELVNKRTDNLMKKIFSHSKVVEKFTSVQFKDIEPSVRKELSFDRLGLSKKNLALKMVKSGLLPKNFLKWKHVQNLKI